MSAPEAGRGLRVALALAALAGLAAVLVFAGSLHNGFAYDDVPLVLGDPRLRGAFRLGPFLAKPYWGGSGDLALYRPLTNLSLALDHALFGFSAAGYHAQNLLWYGVDAGLVVLLLLRFFPPAAALVGGLLFAVHPVHAEAVANIAGRAELLAGTFFLAACLAWLWGRAPATERDGVPGGGRAVLVAALFALALLAKESSVMLPAALLLLDFGSGRFSPTRRSVAAYLRREGQAYLALLVVLAAFLAARTAVIGGLGPGVVHPAADVVGRTGRLLTALEAWPQYLRLLLFPRVLLSDYGPRIIMPAVGWTPAAAAGAVLLLGLVAAGGVAAFKGRRRAALGLLWFPTMVLPVSNLLLTIGVLVAERTLYVPSVALSIAAAGVAEALGRDRVRRLRPAAAVAFLLAVGLLAARSVARVPDWRSTDRIFRALVRDRPDSYRAHWYFGRAARSTGDLPRAVAELDTAVKLWPYRQRLLVEAAATALSAGDPARAAGYSTLATRRWPRDVSSWRLLAVSAVQLGDTAGALGAVRAGLGVDPADGLLVEMRDSLATAGRAR